MKKWINILTLVALLCPMSQAQHRLVVRDTPKPTPEITLNADQQQMVKRQNDFAFRFFAQINQVPRDVNVFVSPLSASQCLSMIMNGAEGETRSEIIKTLAPGTDTLDLKAFNTFNRYLVQQLFSMDPSVKITIANSIWVNKNFPVFDTFIQTNKKIYDAKVSNLNFSARNSVNQINGWCARKTNDLIPKVLDKLSAEEQMYLINAFYFKGTWSDQFHKASTRIETFGDGLKVPMMHQERTYRYSQHERFAIAELPYGNGAFGITIILPNEGQTVQDCLEQLTAEHWEEWSSSFSRTLLDLKMPKMQMRYDRNLIADMQALGIRQAFSRDQANFAKISRVPLFLGVLKQLAYIKVDEEGTEAAAVTTGGMMTTSVQPQEAIPFYVNRPFIFMIRERTTGIILFMGKVMRPISD